MFSLFRDTWPFFTLIALGLAFAALSEVMDYFFPGHGWMIVAYGIAAFGVSFMVWTFWKHW